MVRHPTPQLFQESVSKTNKKIGTKLTKGGMIIVFIPDTSWNMSDIKSLGLKATKKWMQWKMRI